MERIVREESELCRRVTEAVSAGPRRKGPAEGDVLAELERLREQLLSGGGAEDHAALTAEFNRQSAILDQIRESRASVSVPPQTSTNGIK